MTTPTITPAETYSHGRMAYDRATSPTVPSSIRHYVAREADALLDVLELFEDIEQGRTHPASVWDEMKLEAEPVHAALALVAEAIAERAADLIAVFPGCAVTVTEAAA